MLAKTIGVGGTRLCGYSNSPLLPKARRQVVNLVLKEGFRVSTAARWTGVHRSTLYRWLARVGEDGLKNIPTRSSKPKSCPHALDPAVVARIIELRKEHWRCSALLTRESVHVSQSSVHNVLCRAGLLRTKHGKPSRPDFPRVQRPAVEAAGDLVKVDTIHLGTKSSGGRLCYVYTLVDLKTRRAYAEVHARQGPVVSAAFVGRAQERFPHAFKMIQSDHGSVFSKTFEKLPKTAGIAQRRARPGQKERPSPRREV